MFSNLKNVVSKSTTSINKKNYDVIFQFKNIKRTLITISISLEKMKELGWSENTKVVIYSDGKQRLGFLPNDSLSGYVLVKVLNKNREITGYKINFTWHESICKKMNNISITDDSNNDIYITTQVIDGGLLILIPKE